jgi:tetratricopeptide (TPR) repeat protein
MLVAATGCNEDHNRSIEVMNKGVEAGRQKIFDTAITNLKQATLIDPTNAAAFFNLGVIYKDMRKWPEAADAFTAAARIDTDNPALHYELGNALWEQSLPPDPVAHPEKQGDPAKVGEAEAEFTKALSFDPKLYKAHYRLGVALQAQDKLREADAEYRKAIESNPRFVQPYLKLGDMYLDNDYDKEAAQVFQNAILANDSDGDAHQGLAEALQKQKQYEEAIKEFQKAVQLNPDLYLAYYNVGHTYKLLNDKVHAKEWLDKFIKGYSSKAGPELSKAASDEIYALDAP